MLLVYSCLKLWPSLVFNIFWFWIAQHIVVPFTKLIQFVADLLGYLCKKVICFVGRMMFCLHLVTMRMEGPIYFILKQNWKKYQFRYPFFPFVTNNTCVIQSGIFYCYWDRNVAQKFLFSQKLGIFKTLSGYVCLFLGFTHQMRNGICISPRCQKSGLSLM